MHIRIYSLFVFRKSSLPSDNQHKKSVIICLSIVFCESLPPFCFHISILMRTGTAPIRPLGYFLSHYTVLPAETTSNFGSGQLQLAPTKSGKAAVEAVEGVVGRFVCSEFVNGKIGVPKSDRKSAPQREVRRVVTRFVHKSGILSNSDDLKTVQQVIDQAAPEVRLWQHIGEAIAVEKSSLCVHPLLECWVEVENSVPIPQTPLQNMMMDRDKWSEENATEEPDLQHDLEESTCAVYMVLSLVDTEARPTLASLIAKKFTWSTEDVYLVLYQLTSFTRLASAFNRKGLRRKGNEGTFLLDLDPTRIHLTVDPLSNSVSAVTFSMDCITTASRSGTDFVATSPSVLLVQAEFDSSLWQRVRFVGRSNSRDVPKGCSEDPTCCTVSIAGQKATMFLIGLIVLRMAIVPTFESAAVRFFPGNSKPAYFVGADGQLLHDSALRSVILQLIDPEDVNRPGANQVLETISKGEGGEFGSMRSRRTSLNASRRSTFVGYASIKEEEGLSSTRRSSSMLPSPSSKAASPKLPSGNQQNTVSPLGPLNHEDSSRRMTPPSPRPPGANHQHSAVGAPSPPAPTDRDIANIFSHCVKHSAVHARHPRLTPVDAPIKSAPTSLSTPSRLPKLNSETPFEENKRRLISKCLVLATLHGDVSNKKRDAKFTHELLEAAYYKGWAADPTRVDANSLSLLPQPPSSRRNEGTNNQHQQQQVGHHVAVRDARHGTPASSTSTRRTAETPANDTRPSPLKASAATTMTVLPVTASFEL